MLEPSGLCSLRLRTPCEWDGVFYQAVGAVEPVPVLSGAGAGGPVTWDPGCRVPARSRCQRSQSMPTTSLANTASQHAHTPAVPLQPLTHTDWFHSRPGLQC